MKYNAEQIGKRIRLEREKHGWSQKKLGEMLHISSKQISIYESGTLPPMDNLLALCDLFDCELGYLLGEDDYANKTKLETKIYETIGLNRESIKILEYITSATSRFHFGYESETFRRLLNTLITSDNFMALVDSLYTLDEIYLTAKEQEAQLASSFSENVLKEAYNLYAGSIDYEHDPSFPTPSVEVVSAIKMLDSIIDKTHDLDHSIKVARYDLNESFLMLINEMFNKKKYPYSFEKSENI